MSDGRINEVRQMIEAAGMAINECIEKREYDGAKAWAEDCINLINRLQELESPQSQEVAQ